MKNHNILKVRFNNVDIANKIKNEGTKLFGFICTIIEQERNNNNIKQCMKCYQYTHFTYECNATQQICSECSSTEHTWKTCEAEIKRCTQCQEEHRTFSTTCKIRKEKIMEEEKERKNKEKENNQIMTHTNVTPETININSNTFANVLKNNTQETSTETRHVSQPTTHATNENIEQLIATAVNSAVRAEINEIHDKVKKTVKEIITQEMTSHVAAIKEMQERQENMYVSVIIEINKLKEELKMEREQKRKETSTDTENDNFKAPPRKLRARKKIENRKTTPIGHNTGRYEILSDMEGEQITDKNCEASKNKILTKRNEKTKIPTIMHCKINKSETQNKEINKRLELDIDTDNIMRETSSTSVDEYDDAEIDHYIENMTNIISIETSPENKIPSNETSPEIIPMIPITSPAIIPMVPITSPTIIPMVPMTNIYNRTVTREIIKYSNQQEIEIKEQNIKTKESNVDEVYRREHEELLEEEKKRREIIQEKKKKIQKEIVKEINEAIEEYDKKLTAGPIHGTLDWTPLINLLEISPSPNMQRWAEIERKLEQEDEERRYIDDK